MAIRKIIPLLFISIFLFFLLVLLASRPSAAQEPDPPPAKGPEPTPAALTPEPTPSPPPFQIDRNLLPKIEPQLLKRLLTTNGEPAPFIVYLKAQADLATAIASASAGINPQAASEPLFRRAAIVNALQQTARNTQSDVLQILRVSSSPGGLSGQSISTTDIKPLWIVNAVAAKGSLETVLALAAHPDVEVIRLDKEIKLSPSISDFRFPIFDCRLANCPPQIQNLPSAKIQNSPEWGVSKIRADLVHNALGIDGTGVVVANIDTGVDWFHPALQTKYRGYTGAGHLPQHVGNWFDATGEGATYPVDTNGHGTHTMGTLVGDNGIGVAPGAKWVAVRAFNSSGSAQNSWLHDAFQWVLAPNGDPALAPHIVNNSWGSSNGAGTEFEADVQTLLAAGIFPVFSAGNSGPGSGTVNSPGSLDSAFSVGATDINDDIATFSSRGPSPWGKTKPEVSAPGKNVLSSLPGGTYGNFSGTSMAAPHAAGLAALLMQASPAITNDLTDISAAMMSTAVQLGSPIPNNIYGWGRIDAYNAVISVGAFGTMQGTVTQAGSGTPISNATIQITPRSSGPSINAGSDAGGAYLQGLAADTYDASASAFGYNPETAFNIVVITGTPTIQNFSLTLKPTGILQGTVRDKTTNAPLAATITIDGAPASTTTNPADGSYSLSLPIGVYTATVVAAQHRITKAVNITIDDGATVTRDFLLDSAPAILLVDSGRWYQESQIGYYQQALDDLLYAYDTWQITKPFDTPNDVPTAATLSNYDIVIWSSPLDSPGFIGADDEIATFLNGGGKLLLSGQDIAYYDGFWLWTVAYLKDLLKASYVQDNSGIDTISGVAGEPFAGMSLSITNGDGADNQTSPDVIANADSDFAGSLLAYSENSLAGLHIGLCVPYRAMFLSFGFEAINSQADRSQVMEQAIDWLMQLPDQAGVELTPDDKTLIGNFGTVVSHTVRVRNTGAISDVFTLTLSSGVPYNWPASGVPASISLGACQSQEITTEVQIPAAKTWHISDTFTLTAQSNNNPAITDTATRTTKTPAPVLLVDDDRWFSFAGEFKEALTANNIPYDYWFVPKSWSGPVPPSPPLETLQMYPMTVWYTAYDWFQPLTPTEEDRLANYLDGGGRLFLSGQDFLYNHLLDHDGAYSPFAQDYLGVLAHTEDFSSTLTVGRLDSPVGAYLGPYLLTFPPGYNNWTDALTPTATAVIATLGQDNQPNALTNAGVGSGGNRWHTAFFAYGPELLTSPARARLMQRSLGWLSWLGSSTIAPDSTAMVDGSLVTYTATIANNGQDAISTAYFTATFPAELGLTTYSSELAPSGSNLVWSGPLAKNQSKVFTYTATIAGSLPLGTVISQTGWLAYPAHNILFDRVATVKINFPDLNTSTISVNPAQGAEVNDLLTYTIVLKNTGVVDDPMVTTTNTLPPMLDLVSIDAPSRGTVISNAGSLTWTTPLAKNEVATLTYRAVISYKTSTAIENTAYANDGINDSLVLKAQTTFKTIPYYLPIIFKN